MLVNVILSIITAVLFIGAGGSKVAATSMMVASAEHLRLSVSAFRLIGGLEILGAVGLLLGFIGALDFLGWLAAIGLVLLMVGAVSFHVRAKDNAKALAPAGVAGVLSVATLITQLAT